MARIMRATAKKVQSIMPAPVLWAGPITSRPGRVACNYSRSQIQLNVILLTEYERNLEESREGKPVHRSDRQTFLMLEILIDICVTHLKIV